MSNPTCERSADWKTYNEPTGMNVTITGGTGLIGARLAENLLGSGDGVHIVSRSPRTGLTPGVRLSLWDSEKGPPPPECLEEADAVVHLAGEPLGQRWTPETKRRMRDSRVEGTRQLVQALGTVSRRPRVLVSASAIGYYGSRGDEMLEETAKPGDDFLAQLCQDWEAAAAEAGKLGIRVVTLRSGLVLAPSGTLARMLPPFKLGFGGQLGSGRQWMSWIHLEDAVRLIRFAIEDEALSGAVNGTAPNPVRNSQWTRTLARVLRRPALFPVPEKALRLVFGEMAELLLVSQRVVPAAAEAAGYQFAFPELGQALKNLLG